MTLEEAAELVLLGIRWVNCPNGDVNGSHSPKRLEQCPLCKGYATIIDPVCAEAWALVGLPLPANPGDLRRPQVMYMTEENWEDICDWTSKP